MRQSANFVFGSCLLVNNRVNDDVQEDREHEAFVHDAKRFMSNDHLWSRPKKPATVTRQQKARRTVLNVLNAKIVSQSAAISPSGTERERGSSRTPLWHSEGLPGHRQPGAQRSSVDDSDQASPLNSRACARPLLMSRTRCLLLAGTGSLRLRLSASASAVASLGLAVTVCGFK